MKTIKVEVEYFPSNGSKISSLTALNDEGCNVSNKDSIIDTEDSLGFKGFHFANVQNQYPSNCIGFFKFYSKSGFKGYCSKSLSDNLGYINISFKLTFNNVVPKYLSINFDYLSNSWATEFNITNSQNSNIITISNNNNYKSFINLSSLNITEGASIIITFTKINNTYSNLKITKMSFDFISTYNDDVIKDMKCSESLMDTTFNITPTVLEQYAEISFKDKYNEFKKLAISDMLNDNLNVNIYIDDILIGSYVTDSWDITTTSIDVFLNCIDPSSTFSHIYVELPDLSTRNVDNLLQLAFSYTDKTYTYIDVETENYCKSIEVPNSWYKITTLLELLNKICNLGLLRIYWYKNTFIVARCY